MTITGTDQTPNPADTDRWATARAVADATLYEGYVLYPYRASSAKNRVRWQFGVLAPRAFAEADGSERWRSRTECLVEPGQVPVLHLRARFLQLVHRTVEAVDADGRFAPAEELAVEGVRWVPWDEAVERIVDVPLQTLLPLAQAGTVEAFRFEPGDEVEELADAEGTVVVGRIVRRREAAEGEIHLAVDWAAGSNALLKLTIEVRNTSTWGADGSTLAGGRDANLGPSLLGVHTLLAIDDGKFTSVIDPPDGAVEAVADCTQDGTFPVLIGGPDADEDDQWADVVLSSPITLYDNPVVAPESQGDLFDACEIDEILALRVLTLTDEEKAEARGTDPRAAAIVDRCDDMPPEIWDRLHGAVRSIGPSVGAVAEAEEKVPWWDPAADASVDPWTDTLRIGDEDVGKGTKVRLRPNRRSDAHDFFVDGMDATVAGIFSDVDGSQQVAVSLDDDPATEELAWQGRYLFFFPDEVEVIT